MSYFIAFFSPDTGALMSQTDAIIFGTAFVGLRATHNLIHHIYFLGLERTGLKIRVAACAVIFRKVIRLIK